MKRGRAPTAAGEYADLHLRIMVEDAVRDGKSEREIEALVKRTEAEDRQAREDWRLPRAA
ncbi:MAG: hypothetical protein WBQ14_10600 [Gaiellaceae bacterium]